jgi:hypothetical protein
MPKTAVALFTNPGLVEDVVKEIEKLGIPKQDVRTLEEPGTFPVNGVMSFTRLDFEVELKHCTERDRSNRVGRRGLRTGAAKRRRLGVGQRPG